MPQACACGVNEPGMLTMAFVLDISLYSEGHLVSPELCCHVGFPRRPLSVASPAADTILLPSVRDFLFGFCFFYPTWKREDGSGALGTEGDHLDLGL